MHGLSTVLSWMHLTQGEWRWVRVGTGAWPCEQLTFFPTLRASNGRAIGGWYDVAGAARHDERRLPDQVHRRSYRQGAVLVRAAHARREPPTECCRRIPPHLPKFDHIRDQWWSLCAPTRVCWCWCWTICGLDGRRERRRSNARASVPKPKLVTGRVEC